MRELLPRIATGEEIQKLITELYATPADVVAKTAALVMFTRALAVEFAGAGVRGGRAVGSTDATGANSNDFGWSRGRALPAGAANWRCARHSRLLE